MAAPQRREAARGIELRSQVSELPGPANALASEPGG